MLAHIYRADGREEDIELDYCYSDEEAAIAVCEDGDFGSGDRAIVCVTRWDSTRKRFTHRMVRVVVMALTISGWRLPPLANEMPR